MKTLEMITNELENRGYQLKPYHEDDKKEFYAIYRQVILAGNNYPQEFGTQDEFEACFFTQGSSVYICKSANELIGGFNIKPNFPGRASHIANAAYMLSKTARGKGLGALLVEASIVY